MRPSPSVKLAAMLCPATPIRRALQRAVAAHVIGLCLAMTAAAQTVTDSSYVAARNAAIRALTAREQRGDTGSTLVAAGDSALQALENQLRRVVGPFSAPEFTGPGRINLQTLFDELGFGALDAMMYQSSDGRSFTVVTTRSLLARWLTEPTSHSRPLPHDPISALRSPQFYGEALQRDAQFFRYADIPISSSSSSSGVVTAMLVLEAQDIGPFTPDNVIVSVSRGSRIFIVVAPASVIIETPTACRRIWQSATSGKVAAIASQDSVDVAYRACYALHAQRNAALKKLSAQVDGIAASLPPA